MWPIVLVLERETALKLPICGEVWELQYDDLGCLDANNLGV